MKQSEDKKREQTKKIIQAISNLPDDMITKANPENWKDGVYIGEQSESEKNDVHEDKQNNTIKFGEGFIRHRKIVSLAAMLFVFIVVTGVWKMNSIDMKIEDNLMDKQESYEFQTDEPENTYNAMNEKKKSKKKKQKDKREKRVIQKEDKKDKNKNDMQSEKDTPSDDDNEPLPTMGSYSDENDNNSKRKGVDAGNDEEEKDKVNENDAQASALPTPDSNNNSTDKNESEINVLAYKIDSQGNRTAINIQNSDKKRIVSIVEEKKYSSGTASGEYSAVIRYGGKEYFYDAKSKELIVSGKCTSLSENENIELKKILKLD